MCMPKDLPEVIFRYAYPLDMNRRRYFERENKGEYPSIDEVKKEKRQWEELWSDLNEDKQVMKAIAEITGIVYPYSIQVFVIGGGLNPMSEPLILPVKTKLSDQEGSREELILHELLHVILDDPQSVSEIQNYRDYIHDKYEGESPKTINHILVYAVLTKLFERFLPAFSIDDFIKKEWEHYWRAWEIVQKEGSDTIIKKFRELTA